jgi:hypothetical protein
MHDERSDIMHLSLFFGIYISDCATPQEQEQSYTNGDEE